MYTIHLNKFLVSLTTAIPLMRSNHSFPHEIRLNIETDSNFFSSIWISVHLLLSLSLRNGRAR